jgi:hypothetical protein
MVHRTVSFNGMKSLIELAKGHIRDGEQRVRHQQGIVDALEDSGSEIDANLARTLLKAYQVSLDLARQDLARYEASDRFQPHC